MIWGQQAHLNTWKAIPEKESINLAQEKSKEAMRMFKGQKRMHQFSAGFNINQNTLVQSFQNKEKYDCKGLTSETSESEDHWSQSDSDS